MSVLGYVCDCALKIQYTTRSTQTVCLLGSSCATRVHYKELGVAMENKETLSRGEIWQHWGLCGLSLDTVAIDSARNCQIFECCLQDLSKLHHFRQLHLLKRDGQPFDHDYHQWVRFLVTLETRTGMLLFSTPLTHVVFTKANLCRCAHVRGRFRRFRWNHADSRQLTHDISETISQA